MNSRTHQLVLALTACACFSVFTEAQGQTPEINSFAGQWLSKDRDGVYSMSACPEGLCGVLVGVKPHVHKNGKPDPGCGKQVLTLTKWTPEKQRWEGKVLDPKSNKQYPVTLESGKNGPLMKVSWGLLSFSDNWKRFEGTVTPECEIREGAR